MTAKKYLLVVGGPTASGKTDVALALARHFDTVILSADSRQFYREMTIGTAKPEKAVLEAVPHYFIDSLGITESYSAGDFEREGLLLLEQLFQSRDIVVVAGGSGLFIKALCEGFDLFPEVSEAAQTKVREWYAGGGLVALQQRLQEADPLYYEQVDRDNPQRLMRALAVWESTGQPYSDFRKGQTHQRPFESIYLMLDWPREVLYERINRRVAEMVDRGLVEEAHSLYPQRHLNALQTVGYQELFEYFSGQTTLETAIAAIAQHSRNYAKRQLTWFRNQGNWKRFHPSELDICLRYIQWIIRHDLNFQGLRRAETGTETLTFVSNDTPVASAVCQLTPRAVHVQIPEVQEYPEAVEFLWHECRHRYAEKQIFVDP